MSLAATVKAMAAAGCSAEQIAKVVEHIESERSEKKRIGNAERQRRWRERNANNALQALRNADNASQKEMSPTPPIRKTTSSLRSDVDPPPPSGVTPVVEKQKRASRLPANWTLPENYREAARQRGIADEEIERQAARMLNWSLSSKTGAKLDWFRTWLNWIDDCPRQAARGSPQNVTPIRRGGAAYLLMDALEEQRREREKDINSQAFEQLPFIRAE